MASSSSHCSTAAWVSTVRRKSTREEITGNLLAVKIQGTNRSGEGGEERAM